MDGKGSSTNSAFIFWSAFFFSRDLLCDPVFNSKQAMKLSHKVIIFDDFSSYRYVRKWSEYKIVFHSFSCDTVLILFDTVASKVPFGAHC